MVIGPKDRPLAKLIREENYIVGISKKGGIRKKETVIHSILGNYRINKILKVN